MIQVIKGLRKGLGTGNWFVEPTNDVHIVVMLKVNNWLGCIQKGSFTYCPDDTQCP